MRSLSIKNLKESFIKKYPKTEVSMILRRQPDFITEDSFITLASVLLSVVEVTKE